MAKKKSRRRRPSVSETFAEEFVGLFVASEYRRLRLDQEAYAVLRGYAVSVGTELPPYSERFRVHLEPRPGPLGPPTTMSEEEP